MKDYYIILEVPRDATRADIRKAHRRLVVRFHPDVSEEPDAERFREVQEACEVLSDEEERRAYNHGLLAQEQRILPVVLAGRERTVVFWQDFDTVVPSIGKILSHLRSNYFGPVPKVDPLRHLSLEVVMTPEEAARGVTFPVDVPVYHPCPECGGTGREFPFVCLRGSGRGRQWAKETFVLRIPPGVQDGAVLRHPLHTLGIEHLQLNVFVRID
jgi:molecular chaperone DnaJ